MLIVDSFAGGGGASTGIELALGVSPTIAVNHCAEAIAVHTSNHPRTRHLCESVYTVDPVEVCGGQSPDLAWFSPDCTHFSRAKGGKPVSNKRRGLAWIVVAWAQRVRPRVIVVENVPEFLTWGPCGEDGRPRADHVGRTFRAWAGKLRRLGYTIEWRKLRACDYGAPTTRERLFVIASLDQPRWPAPTHGAPGGLHRLLPYRTAAEIIDWSIPCPSIFGRKKDLVEATKRRIARGVFRHVIGNARPFIVPITHHGDRPGTTIDQPVPTVTGAHRGELALIAPTMIQTGYGERPGQAPRTLDLHQPLTTAVAGGQKHGLVAAFLAKNFGGHEGSGISLAQPTDTITTQDHHALVTASLGVDRRAEVRAFLIAYYGTDQDSRLDRPLPTVTTHDRFGLVTVNGIDYEIADIGMRLLTPRELASAQGFPASYVLDPIFGGKPLTKTAQVRIVGNSVCPDVAAAIVRANLGVGAARWSSAA